MPSALIRKVADYCWSHNFLDVFHKFFADHADAFVGAPEICGGEHNMEYYSLFQKYLLVYEDTLTKFVSSIDCSIEEFYVEVREAQEESVDPYLRVFIDCLLASADYESFYKVMVREGKKKVIALKKTEKLAEAKTLAESAGGGEGKVAVEPGAGAAAGDAKEGKLTSPDRDLSSDMKSLDVRDSPGGPAESKGDAKESDAKGESGDKATTADSK